MASQIACLIILFTTILSTCFCQNTYPYSQPDELEDGWKTNSLITLEMDTTKIHSLYSKLNSNKHQIHSILLVKDGELIIEEYFDTININQQHDLRSVTKSVTSLLMGIAIDKGFIESIDDPIYKYLGDLRPSKNLDIKKEKITIKHLLTMSTGLDCNDWDKKSKGGEDKVYCKKDWLQYFLNLKMVAEPGSVSNYCTMGQILAMEIISKVSDMPIDQFAKTYLFEPLGITNISWNFTTKKEVIASGKRLQMTSRDMAKIGQLALNGGDWNGKQIVSQKWINEATSPKTKIGGIDYGYLWWSIPMGSQGKVYSTKLATGNGGQYIMIMPELNAIAIFTGGAYNSEEDKIPFAILTDILIPTIINE